MIIVCESEREWEEYQKLINGSIFDDTVEHISLFRNLFAPHSCRVSLFGKMEKPESTDIDMESEYLGTKENVSAEEFVKHFESVLTSTTPFGDQPAH
jgi:hypothetical protein